MPRSVADPIKIDLSARTITPEQRVWRLFPGSGYQFLDDFKQQNVGFLDFPVASNAGARRKVVSRRAVI